MPTKILICTNERTGSSFLCDAMRAGGLGSPTEFFNDRAIDKHASNLGCQLEKERESSVVDFVGALVERRAVHGVFSAKIHSGHARRWLLGRAGKLLFEDAFVVHLYRLDARAQIASYLAASSSGLWTARADSVGGQQSSQWPPSTSRVEEIARMLTAGEQFWRLFFAYRSTVPKPITYEQLVSNPIATIEAIGAAAGVAVQVDAVRETVAKTGRYEIDLDNKDFVVRNVLPQLDWVSMLVK